MRKSALCWINGQLIPASEASISVFDHGLLYGDGIFEGIRFYNNHAFQLAAHLTRLADSAAAICLLIPYSQEQLTQAVTELVEIFPDSTGYLRLIVTRGTGPLGLNPDSCTQPTVLIIADHLLMVNQNQRQQGIRLMIASTRRTPTDSLDGRIKSLNYLNNILARIEANQAGFDDAILLNQSGFVTEASAANLFIARDGHLYTPHTADGALQGITREIVIKLASEQTLPVSETALTAYDMYTADECFLTGTGAELIAVREVDGRLLRQCPGPVLTTLTRLFTELIHQQTS